MTDLAPPAPPDDELDTTLTRARADVVGHDPVLPTAFPIGELAATALAATGRLAAEVAGRPQAARVDVGAAAASLVGFGLQKLDGETPLRTALGNPLVAFYECRDGRWIHLHGSFPRLAARTRQVIGEGDDVAALVRRWDAQGLEDALAEAGTCGAMVRTTAEWSDHPQQAALQPLGPVSVTRIGDADPEPFEGGGEQLLDRLRVLDLTRVLAGPTCGRTLASYGADVLLVNGPGAPNVPAFVLDTSHGKRSAVVDLDTEPEVLRQLVLQADVFVQSYRSGALEQRSFGATDVAALRPGIVYVTINCYGDAGPWRERPGWEQLAQSVSGLAAAQGGDGPPALLPAAACDYTPGYLAAVGVLEALRRRAVEGGSWHVQASLCQTAGWILTAGARCDPAAATGLPDLARWMQTSVRPEGTLEHLGPVVELERDPVRWSRPSPPIGHDTPTW
jgi:crotonobetainyl-CoA:carnitine CoA-transferase CaiB-like acyl-CoA transferase